MENFAPEAEINGETTSTFLGAQGQKQPPSMREGDHEVVEGVREVKKETPSVGYAATVSLRLGHGAVLTTHRVVIHYRPATSLPQRWRSRAKGTSLKEGDCETPRPEDYIAVWEHPFQP